MPIYEYECLSCSHRFEELIRSAGQERKLSCPDCGSRRIRRRLSTFAAVQSSEDNPGCPTCPPEPPDVCTQCDSPKGACPFS